MLSKTIILYTLATLALAQNPGDKITGKKVTELGNGVYSANTDGSFTFLGGGGTSNSTTGGQGSAGQSGSNKTKKPGHTTETGKHHSTPTSGASSPHHTKASRLFARSSVYPGKVTCDGTEGAVDATDLMQAATDFENYCGVQHAVGGHSYAFAKWDQAVVYMCEQGMYQGYCKAPEVRAAIAQVKTNCRGGESGWSTCSSWYKTYGYKVASDTKICGKTPT